MKKNILFLLCAITPTIAWGIESKTDQEVFNKWLKWQKVFEESSIQTMKERVDADFGSRMVAYAQRHYEQLKPLLPCISTITGQDLAVKQIHSTLTEAGKKQCKQLYEWLDNDIEKFLQYVKNSYFINDSINQHEARVDINETITKYKTFMKLLLTQEDKKKRHQDLFGIANRLFEYSFGEKGFDQFYALINNKPLHQVGRLCYSIMWYYLVGDGWKHWHESCLQALAQDAKKGKEIVYIAGGADLLKLLDRGVYKIRVIDPMLPTQPEYYAEGWEWLIKGDIGDQLTLASISKKLIMKRASYKEDGTFNALLSNSQTVALPKSVTTWSIYDQTGKKKLGYVTYERRFCEQKDFSDNQSKSLLASFNEMYFVSALDSVGGWGIDVESLSPKMSMHVKQLRKPVGKQVMLNLRKNDQANLAFIMIGSNPT